MKERKKVAFDRVEGVRSGGLVHPSEGLIYPLKCRRLCRRFEIVMQIIKTEGLLYPYNCILTILAIYDPILIICKYSQKPPI